MHCLGKLNPADIPSRGLDINPGVNRHVWLRGPEFLTSSDVLHVDDQIFEQSIDEYTKSSNMLAVVTDQCKNVPDIKGIGKIVQIERYSYIGRLLLVTCYVLRFSHNIRNKSTPRVGEITASEVDVARSVWIKYVQSFIIANKNYWNGLKCSLGAFIDDYGFIRLKGRFEYAEIKCKEPILLPKNNAFTKLVILNAHEDVKHLKMKNTLNQLRNEYWVITNQ